MPDTLQVLNPSLAVVAELNGTGTTDTKKIHFCPGDPMLDEAVFVTWEIDGGTLTKQRHRWRRGHIVIMIPAQASKAALRTRVQSIRDAFLTTGNYLKHQYAGDTAQLYRLVASTLPSPLEDPDVARAVDLQNMVTRWEFEFTMEHKATTDLSYAIF